MQHFSVHLVKSGKLGAPLLKEPSAESARIMAEEMFRLVPDREVVACVHESGSVEYHVLARFAP